MRFAAWTSNKTKQQKQRKNREKLNAHATAADTTELKKKHTHRPTQQANGASRKKVDVCSAKTEKNQNVLRFDT